MGIIDCLTWCIVFLMFHKFSKEMVHVLIAQVVKFLLQMVNHAESDHAFKVKFVLTMVALSESNAKQIWTTSTRCCTNVNIRRKGASPGYLHTTRRSTAQGSSMAVIAQVTSSTQTAQWHECFITQLK